MDIKIKKVLLYLINIIVLLLALSSFYLAALALYSKFVTHVTVGMIGHMGWINILIPLIGLAAFVFYYRSKKLIMMMFSGLLLLSQLFLIFFVG